MDAPWRIKSNVPNNPIKTPKTCRLVDFNLKTKKPKTIVFNGTREFKIEATALSISVSAKANRNDGKKVPNSPVKITHFQSLKAIDFTRLNATINKKTAVNIIRIAPSCTGVKPTKPFFMSIKELPQINDRTTRHNHFKEFAGILKQCYFYHKSVTFKAINSKN